MGLLLIIVILNQSTMVILRERRPIWQKCRLKCLQMKSNFLKNNPRERKGYCMGYLGETIDPVFLMVESG